MGRPRKPTADHLRDGTHRVDRHGGRMREPQFSGEPVKPKGMSKESQAHWDHVVPMLVEHGVSKSIDTCSLQMMCEMWAEYRAALRMRPYGIDDKRKRLMMINSAAKSWNALASKFGMTPADRARLEIDLGDDKANPFEEFMKARMSQN